MKLSQTQIQKQILAPSMQQSIEILMLPLMDLHLTINQELQNNPLLEVEEDSARVEDAPPPPPIMESHAPAAPEREGGEVSQQEEDSPDDRPWAATETLEEKLLKQLRFETSDPLDLKIGEYILGNLTDDGYLLLSPEDIATSLDLESAERVEKVRAIIQGLDPLGIGSRNLQECLLAQIPERLNGGGALARKIIESYLQELSQKKYPHIARHLGVKPEAVKEAAQAIASLEPRPARNYRPIQANTYIKPDLFIYRDKNQGYQVLLNEAEVPRLRVSPVYKDMLSRPNLQPEEREFIQERMKNAALFIKSVQQRGQTLRNITQYILEKQQEFFEHDHMALQPLTLREVASVVRRNESTISRAIHNKYVETPHGLFPLKFFFSQAVGRTDADGQPQASTSSRSIKEEIKELIAAEDKAHPLSDQEIQEIFEKKGMQIARRTISKYRQMLNILPSHLRKS